MRTSKPTIRGRLVHTVQLALRNISPRMDAINGVTLIISIVLAIAALLVMNKILDTYALTERASQTYNRCERAIGDLQDASDHLTAETREYVTTARRSHLDRYLSELLEHDRRGNALRTLETEAQSDDALNAVREAKESSDDLAKTELYAMRLVADASGLDDVPAPLAAVELNAEDASLSNNQKRALAHTLVTGADYSTQKANVDSLIHACSTTLMGDLRAQLDQDNATLDGLIGRMRARVIALLLMVLLSIVFNSVFVLWPMSLHAHNIRADKPLTPSGARELRYLTDAYNEMYAERHANTARLKHEAETDPLTGVFNRGAYESLLGEHVHDMALILVDVDNFKRFNDEYGHDMGDAVLTEVAASLSHSFRTSDHVCRIGGDEFAVIMTHADPTMRDVIADKIEAVASFLRDEGNGIPAATISVGVAFASDVQGGAEELFRSADQALYTIKRGGRDGLAFDGDAL